MEMIHRSKWFDAISKDTEATLRRVMNIPDNYKVVFFPVSYTHLACRITACTALTARHTPWRTTALPTCAHGMWKASARTA